MKRLPRLFAASRSTGTPPESLCCRESNPVGSHRKGREPFEPDFVDPPTEVLRRSPCSTRFLRPSLPR